MRQIMSYTERTISVFKTFINDMGTFKELFKILSKDNKNGIIFDYHTCYSNYLCIHVGGVGLLRLHYNIDESSCTFSFKEDNNNLKDSLEKVVYTQSDLNALCDKIIPFMVTKGEDRTDIPLLMNIFPSFAKFALEFVYDPEY